MTILQISLFGNVRVAHTGRQSLEKMTPTNQALLAFLLLHPHRAYPRELLADVFWGDQSQKQARRCLNTALWRLGQILEPEGVSRGTYLLNTSMSEIGFNYESDYWLDVEVFEAQLNSLLAKPIQTMVASDVETLEQALQLYAGELLEGFYDDWILFERERLRRLYLNGQAHLMHYYRHHGAFGLSLACAQKILAQDPLREEIHREIMHLYLESRQRALAVQQYQICCQVLATELGISPMEETQVLYRQILQETPESPTMHSGPTNGLNGNKQVLRELRLSVYKFDRALRQLQRVIRSVEGSLE